VLQVLWLDQFVECLVCRIRKLCRVIGVAGFRTGVKRFLGAALGQILKKGLELVLCNQTKVEFNAYLCGETKAKCLEGFTVKRNDNIVKFGFMKKV